MTLPEFKSSLRNPQPPAHLTPLLQALWHDGRGDWHAAHNVVQDLETPEGSWVHAYLHRKEGDAGNAAYWYRRARRPFARASLGEEWDEIAQNLLARIA